MLSPPAPMKKQLITISLLAINFLPAAFCQQSQPITVNAYLHGKEGIALNYINPRNTEQGLLIKNYTVYDTLITQVINSDADLEMMTRIWRNGHGIKRSFLARRGETINLKVVNNQMVEISGKNIFPQDYLSYRDDFYRKPMKPFSAYTPAEVAEYYADCERIFTANTGQIDSLAKTGSLSAADKAFFTRFNQVDYYERKLWPLFDSQHEFNTVILPYLKNDISAVKTLVKTFKDYRTPELSTLAGNLISYELMQNKINDVDITAVVDFTLSLGYGDLGRNDLLKRIKKYPDKNSPHIVKALNRLATDIYPGQLADINATLLALGQQNKNIDHPESIKLVKADGTFTNLAQLYNKHRGNILLVDFWASWCVPCRLQMPIVKKLKEKYKGKNIRFVSVSMDLDNAKSQWLAALKQDGNFTDLDEYRLVNPKQSEFTKFYQINSIPRYMVVGADSKMVADDFLHAADQQFESKLISLITKPIK